jgi:hypothetical protein
MDGQFVQNSLIVQRRWIAQRWYNQGGKMRFQAGSKGIHVGGWVVQVVLAFAVGFVGAQKLIAPLAELAPRMPFVSDVPAWLVRTIGAFELAGAIGLLLPSLFRIKPRLTPLAATGLAFLMSFAILFHLARGEARAIGPAIVLGTLAAFVAWARFWKAPIAGRST